MDALVFDFDGVVVDSEPVHMAGFQRILQSRGLSLTKEQYYGKYLGYDDHDCFAVFAADHGLAFEESEIDLMTAEKTAVTATRRRGEEERGAPMIHRYVRVCCSHGSDDEALRRACCIGKIEISKWRVIETEFLFLATLKTDELARAKPKFKIHYL